ncbi:NapC/NirT family cytochrome c [Thermincola ferriacetica]
MDNPKKLRLIIIIAAVVIAAVSIGAVEYTSQTGFCNSCHEMNETYAGWQTGIHSGEHCYGCHTDEGIIAKAKVKVNGLREVYIHLTEEVNMDKVVADVPDRRCAKCHDFTGDKYKNTVPGQRIAAFHAQHKEYKFDCLTCHRTVGHTKESFVGFTDSCKACHLAQKTASK